MDQVKFFKACLPQILLGPFLNTLSHISCYETLEGYLVIGFHLPSLKILTALKMSKYRVFSGPYFPVFGLNPGKYVPEKSRI